jgi:hypothetical protein
MDKVLRFSDYEIFAYVATGFGAMLVSDVAFGTHWILGAQWSVSEALAVLLAAYVAGHILAWPAAWSLERHFVRRFLGPPYRALFSDEPSGPLARFKQHMFPDYFTPLDQRIRRRLEAKVHDEGHSTDSEESMFWTAFARAKRDPLTYARLEGFLKLYGFCRNIAFVGFAGAALLISQAIWLMCYDWSAVDVLDRFSWGFGALVIGVAMTYRYLKFQRLYSLEIFVGYLELPHPKGQLP